MAVVGIDLGTTNTVIAAVRDGRATSLKDKADRALLPSVVSFGLKGAPKVGYPAKDRRTIDPENTVFSIKRLIGRTFESEQVKKSIARYPFKLCEGPGKSTLVSCHGETHTLPEISALVLQEAVAIAEQRLGERVSDAVITVPANFNDLQRAATKIAGRTAGLEVLRIVNEPTAAALAYGFGQTGRERIVVYDFGGGTFDITLLDLNENVFEVLSTAGDTFLGGDDVDRVIMDRMAETLLKEQKIDAEKDILVREQLRSAAEKLKIDLSTRSMAKVRVDDLEFEFTMRRSEFETLMEPLLVKTLSVCQEALDVAGVFIKDIDQVLLVGGSTRIPLVRRRVSSFFSKMPQSRINPDEVVAIGAAIQASSLEAKQAPTHIPAAPRPRGLAPGLSSPTSKPLEPGTTKIGLAGLRKTLSGASGPSDVPAEQRSGSVLSGLKSLSLSAAPGVSRTPTLNPTQTLAGVGAVRPALPGLSSSLPPVRPSVTPRLDPEPRTKLSTLSGVGDDRPHLPDTIVDLPETKGTTNLGLGQAPGAPQTQLGASPPRALVPVPVRTPHAFVPRSAGAPLPPETSPSLVQQMDAVVDASGDAVLVEGDGSVTFDLATLEASEGPTSSTLSAELPVVVSHQTKISHQGLPPASVIEELSDSALFTLVDDDDETLDDGTDDLPTAVYHAPNAPLSHDYDFTVDDELDLPSPTSRRLTSARSESSDRDSDLPLPVVRAPTANLPAYQASRQLDLSRQPGLPSRAVGGANEPQGSREPRPNADLVRTAAGVAPAANLPSRGSDLPSATNNISPHLPSRPVADLPSLDLQHAQIESLIPEDDDADDDEFVFAHERPVGLSTEPGRSFDPSFPARSIMDSITELDELSAAPLDTNHGLAAAPNLRPMARSSNSAAALSPPEQAPPVVARPLLLDVTPLSLGVEVVGGYVNKLIERNSPVPCQCTRTFATASDNQALVRIRVSQGEEGRFDQNTVLGEVQLSGLSPGPRGSVKINVSFSLDESGMLQVSAHDPKTGVAANAILMLAGVN